MIYNYEKKRFLKMTSISTLLAAGEWMGLSNVFAQFPSKSVSGYSMVVISRTVAWSIES